MSCAQGQSSAIRSHPEKRVDSLLAKGGKDRAQVAAGLDEVELQFKLTRRFALRIARFIRTAMSMACGSNSCSRPSRFGPNPSELRRSPPRRARRRVGAAMMTTCRRTKSAASAGSVSY